MYQYFLDAKRDFPDKELTGKFILLLISYIIFKAGLSGRN